MSRRRIAACVGVALLALGCRSLSPHAARTEPPSLERIFDSAELLDKRPTLLAIAPDGSSVIARWSPGIPIWSHDDGTLRVIATAAPRGNEPCGVRLADLLPELPTQPRTNTSHANEPLGADDGAAARVTRGEQIDASTATPENDEDPREPSAWTYEREGGALLVARGTGLWRIDALARTRFELLPERSETAAQAASQPAGTLGAIERLEWRGPLEWWVDSKSEEAWNKFRARNPARAQHVFVYDSEDLFVVAADALRGTHALEPSDLVWWSEPLAPSADEVRWSADLNVAFSERTSIVRPPSTTPASAPATSPSPPPPTSLASPTSNPLSTGRVLAPDRMRIHARVLARVSARAARTLLATPLCPLLEHTFTLSLTTPLSPPDSAPAPHPQIWLHDEQRAVELTGFDSLQFREDARLSPDGSWVFALTRDKSRARPPIPVPDYLTERVTTTEGRRETAEDGPWPARLLRWNTHTGERSDVDLPEPFDTGWFGVVGWSPNGRELIMRWTAPDWTCQQYLAIDRRGWRELLSPRDVASGWVGGPANQLVFDEQPRRDAHDSLGFDVAWPWWYAGVERGARCGLESNAIAPLPEFRGEVDEFRALERGGLLVEASTDDPGVREIHVLHHTAAAEASTSRVPQPAGLNHAARASDDARTIAFVHEAGGSPAELWVSDEHGARALTSTTPRGFRELDWIAPRRRTFTSADGTTVWANVWTPARSNAPCIVFVHGAGYLQNVTDSLTEYPLNWMFHARLARLGYAVVDVDYRGSKGYGRKFRTDVHGELGAKELADLHAALDALARERVVDPSRVGVYGGSYGGFLTLMALFLEPGRWRCGAALRSVTDWRSYHPSYTQPRLGKPSTNPDAYTRSSPIDHASGLADPLLLLHGLRDDNVFAQDTLRLVEKLVELGKDFELMVYPSQGHAYDSGAHWLDQYQRIERFLRTHLEAR